MKIVAIEPTPSPNTMKVLLDHELPSGNRNNYTKDQSDVAPEEIQSILAIEGIKGVYHVSDFLAVERNAKYDWESLLIQVRKIFGEDTHDKSTNTKINDHFGEVQVFVQQFKNIPMQIKLTDGMTEKRYSMPDRFLKALNEAQSSQDNVVLQRDWKEYGIRYGEFDEVAAILIEELEATYSKEQLQDIVIGKQKKDENMETYINTEQFLGMSFEERFRYLESLKEISEEHIPLLNSALADDKVAIRRLAVVYLGMIEDEKVLPYLYKALKDKNGSVRRTAGDCLSDLGFSAAMVEMAEALKDRNKLVRWRAAMFLYEEGDESILSQLKEAENDPEFEVKMQVKMAIERIEGGVEAKGSVWKQMTEARTKEGGV
ncbi:virulence factor [Bacillus coahuilensis p1.1.43]|uniref:Virulence factor n=1 Tax=Bacillus coahuilensis p1.1.43 TaxID=1150625 RepID=A0A147K8G5_9BACI|nr:conserved virulence factor C family protein [Bacillus coahuilensis]KUP06499.1 virulence factor [Bacillus coahuilensis p1.1.43]